MEKIDKNEKFRNVKTPVETLTSFLFLKVKEVKKEEKDVGERKHAAAEYTTTTTITRTESSMGSGGGGDGKAQSASSSGTSTSRK